MASRTTWEEQGPTRGRWLLGLGLAVLGGLSWWVYGFAVNAIGFSVSGRDIGTILLATLVAAVPAVTCLVAGWLLRSWTGLFAATGVYVVVSAFMWVLAIGGGPGGMTFLTGEFALYVVLPGVVLSAIGTLIGMSLVRRAA